MILYFGGAELLQIGLLWNNFHNTKLAVRKGPQNLKDYKICEAILICEKYKSWTPQK